MNATGLVVEETKSEKEHAQTQPLRMEEKIVKSKDWGKLKKVLHAMRTLVQVRKHYTIVQLIGHAKLNTHTHIISDNLKLLPL